MKKIVILSLLAVSFGASSVKALPGFLMSKQAKEQQAEERLKKIYEKTRIEMNKRLKEEKVEEKAIERGVHVGLGVVAASYACSFMTDSCGTVCAVVPTTWWPILIPTAVVVGGIAGVGQYAFKSKKIGVEVGLEVLMS